jgi:hypothetical protein
MEMDLDLFATFKPDGDALLRRIAPHIDDGMLENIAETEYGLNVAEHLAELRKVRDGIIARPLRWYPREALELTRWSEPDAVDRAGREGELTGTRGHWARAFSCAALIRAYGDDETREIIDFGFDATLMQLLESLQRLNAGLEDEAMAAVAWFIPRLRDDLFAEDEIPFLGVGLLSLAVKSRRIANSAIVTLVAWLVATEQEHAVNSSGRDEKFADHWLLRISRPIHPEKWTALGNELAAFDAAGPCGDAVRGIGRRLAGGMLEA